MKANIYSHRKLIGTAELKVGDESMGGLYGLFSPNSEYYTSIRKSVWEFWATTKPDYKKWTSLRINVQLENGLFLFPRGGYAIDDMEEMPDEPKQIDMSGVNSQVLIDFFITTPALPFIEKPWNSLEIEQKIGFEDELKRELGLSDTPFFRFFNKLLGDHTLLNAEFSALCHDQRNDDVLFEINKTGCDKQFALVHLTWKGKIENEGYPQTRFFPDFHTFKEQNMLGEVADWQD